MNTDIKQRKFEKLATELRNQIQRGSLKPGDRLPTLAEITLKSGITGPTIIRAHTLLEQEGLITRRRGHGTFVASKKQQDLLAGPLVNTVVVLTPSIASSMMSRKAPGWAFFTTAGILEAVQTTSHHAIMLHPDKVNSQDIDWLIKQRPYGVIIDDNFSRDSEHLRMITEACTQSGIPLVALGSLSLWDNCDRVESDHEQGAYEATRWLIAQGRHRIAPIKPASSDLNWVAKRLLGYARAMEEAGLEPMSALISPELSTESVPCEVFKQRSRQCAVSLFEAMMGLSPCDALLTVSDSPLFYYAAACRLLGKEPGRDILLAGYDNYWHEAPERQWESALPDVTVDKHNVQIGKELVKLLTERINGLCPPVPQIRLVSPSLVPVVTGSTEKHFA